MEHKQDLTQDDLKQDLMYDPVGGLFYWIVDKGTVKAGDVAGCINQQGYVLLKLNYHFYLAHRLAWFYVFDEWPEEDIDHINRIRCDNRLINLRTVSRSDNLKNVGLRANNTSGFNGVHWVKSEERWRATIGHKGKVINLGSFDNKEAAIQSRTQANLNYGYHENHGVVVG